MTLHSKSFIFLILFFPFLSIQPQDQTLAVDQQAISSFQLTRIALPYATSIEKEVKKADFRVFKKYAVTTTVVISALVAMFLCYQLKNVAAAHDTARLQMQLIPKNVDQVQLPEILRPEAPAQGWVSWIAQGSKNFGLSLGGMFANSGLLLVSTLVMNGAYTYASNKLNQVYADETVLWYAHEQTKIPNLFNDLKLYATDYDLYATLLSAELFNQDAQVHIQSFVKDLVGSAQNYLGNDMFQDPAYFQYLLNDVKKKYVQKGKELEKLQEFVVPAAAKRHRAMAQEHATLLFAKDLNRRVDIANMCEMFAQEMQNLTSFIQMRGGLRQQARVADMVESCNAFLAHMETLLNSTPEQLQAFSKKDCGMFTCVYEYEKLFSEQINFLHRYCKLTN